MDNIDKWRGVLKHPDWRTPGYWCKSMHYTCPADILCRNAEFADCPKRIIDLCVKEFGKHNG